MRSLYLCSSTIWYTPKFVQTITSVGLDFRSFAPPWQSARPLPALLLLLYAPHCTRHQQATLDDQGYSFGRPYSPSCSIYQCALCHSTRTGALWTAQSQQPHVCPQPGSLSLSPPAVCGSACSSREVIQFDPRFVLSMSGCLARPLASSSCGGCIRTTLGFSDVTKRVTVRAETIAAGALEVV